VVDKDKDTTDKKDEAYNKNLRLSIIIIALTALVVITLWGTGRILGEGSKHHGEQHKQEGHHGGAASAGVGHKNATVEATAFNQETDGSGDDERIGPDGEAEQVRPRMP
jgi:hypothetical protein